MDVIAIFLLTESTELINLPYSGSILSEGGLVAYDELAVEVAAAVEGRALHRSYSFDKERVLRLRSAETQQP